MESFLYGVGSVVLLSVLIAEGKRELAVEDEAIRVRFVEEKEWMVMEEEKKEWKSVEVGEEEEEVKEEVEKQGSFGAGL